MSREFSFKNAFIYAFFIHVLIMLLFGSKQLQKINLSFFKPAKSFIELRSHKQKRMYFKFVDVPSSVPSQEPLKKDTNLVSDRAAKASGDSIPADKSRKPRSMTPYSKGNLTREVIPSVQAPKPMKKSVENKIENNPVEQESKQLKNYPDSTVIVRNMGTKPSKPNSNNKTEPFDFRNAVRNLDDYLEQSKYNNPDGNLGGSGLSFDVDFSRFGWYAKIIKRRVQKNWQLSLKSMILKETGITKVFFTIQRDGEVTDLEIQHSSGSKRLDMAAYNALKSSSPFPPLPEEFPNPRLRGVFTFHVYD